MNVALKFFQMAFAMGINSVFFYELAKQLIENEKAKALTQQQHSEQQGQQAAVPSLNMRYHTPFAVYVILLITFSVTLNILHSHKL